jgi:murein DD-endopeptidase MepM/ murein hydrolase activator NlpD
MRTLLVLLFLCALVAFGYWMLNSPPFIQPASELKAVGRATPFRFTLDDSSGLRRVRLWWEQGGKTFPVVERDLGGAKHYQGEEVLGPSRQKELQEGAAQLWLEAVDAAWIPKKRVARWEVRVRPRPPRLSVLSGQHYINQGGCEMVVYQVSNDAVWSGVQVGQHSFPGYPMPGAEPGVHFALFAFPYDEPATTVPRVAARDDAGNEAVAAFWYKLFPKAFRRRDVDLADAFLQKVVPDILSHTSEIQEQNDLLKNFLAINGRLRAIDNAKIAALGAKTEKRFLWNEAFVQLGSSQVEAQFADHRTYFYHGRQVDQQDHLGFDLATTQHAPVEAANRGRVIFADYLGIYGNTIVIDHGYGLQTLYGHLNNFNVKPGDMVEKKQIIAQSDSTGLAAGDHLHFSMLLDGQQVTAAEWWDPHWIHDRVLLKFPNQQLPGAM